MTTTTQKPKTTTTTKIEAPKTTTTKATARSILRSIKAEITEPAIFFTTTSPEVYNVQCNYNITNWLHVKTCYVRGANFYSENMNAKYSFSGGYRQKKIVDVVYFECCSRINFVPLEIFKEFPKLIGIAFQDFKIPIVEERLFSDEKFSKIEYMLLDSDNIKWIEDNAFQQMSELVDIALSNNKIQSLSEKVFAHNLKLEIINLLGNQIKMIHPKVFEQLNSITELDLLRNKCINKIVSDIGKGLEDCYENWDEVNESMQNGKDLKLFRIFRLVFVIFFRKLFLPSCSRTHRIYL